MKNLVLIDFTEESIHALKYAIEFSINIGATVEIINVADPLNFPKAYHGLQDLQSRFSTEDYEIGFTELTGTLEEDLTDYINHDKIGFVFCGTHDMSFLERVFSSRVVNLMNNVSANFVFIPSTLEDFKPIKNVLVPIFSDKHSLQNLEALRFLHHFMKFDLTLCSFKEESAELNKTLIVAKKILDSANIPFSMVSIGKNKEEFRDRVADLGNVLESDMVSIVNLTEVNIFNFGAKGFVESIIRNNFGIPVLAIQNHNLETYSSFHTMGGY